MNMGDKKSNFSATCSLLSQYLKHKGSFGDLGLDIKAAKPLDPQITKGSMCRAPPTTMSLLPGVDVCEENGAEENNNNSPKSMNLFPQHTGFDAKEEATTIASSVKDQESEDQQLTIFYGGKVLVFDHFPAGKANDLFRIASKENKTSVGFKAPPVPKPEPAQETYPKPANASDMPIARRNSLHRFLEKRKDRISTKAPYQVHGDSNSNATKPEVGPSWLGLGKPQNTSRNNTK